ncbi:MAG: hypothetical protein A3E78_05825 [Alphaproteobacteria bacterium RIFCSPHIGHO2_12_FULL_63_12]|nr:MAG: hypothetical protein A3E78_05825 [Alphaproteobacteria bacterium RIFCSPHIGHO2_12_FULL_63_12]
MTGGGERLPSSVGAKHDFDAAEIGALAHLYRGEVYRSTIWRTRLDATTNWSVVTLGLALSMSYANPDASPAPLLLVGWLIAVFLIFEARRYRYFNVWRARCRWIETNFYAPLLLRSHRPEPGPWQDVLAQDYLTPQYHISFWRALGRRIRRNYGYIFAFQAFAYVGKIVIHPTPLESFSEFWTRTGVGQVPGVVIIGVGVVFHAVWIWIAIWSRRLDRAKHLHRDGVAGMG